MRIDFPLKTNPRFFGIYLFSLAILYLARDYLGAPFVFLFYIFLLAPFLSLLYLSVAQSFVKYYQYFENEHPVKGEDVRYRLILAAESVLPIPLMSLHFKNIHPYLARVTEDIAFPMHGRSRFEREYVIRCPYRGIYTIGLQSIIFEDFLGIFRIEKRIWYRTFYVYPRILEIEKLPIAERPWIAERRSVPKDLMDILKDTTLFTELREYRRNESLKHVYWKKFASTGRPYIKEYDMSTEESVSICLDMRKGRLSGIDELVAEDTSIEIMISLVNHLSERGIKTRLYIYGAEYAVVENGQQFNELYRKTLLLRFKEYPFLFSGTILITHILDSHLMDIAERTRYGELSPLVIFNLAGASNIDTIEAQLAKLIDRGIRIIRVRDSNRIVEEISIQC